MLFAHECVCNALLGRQNAAALLRFARCRDNESSQYEQYADQKTQVNWIHFIYQPVLVATFYVYIYE